MTVSIEPLTTTTAVRTAIQQPLYVRHYPTDWSDHVMVTAYEWHGDLFCDGDIVFKLTDHEPWSRWVDAGNEPGEDVCEEQLNDIARHFRVNRNNPGSVRRKQFPVLLTEPPQPGAFCAACKRFFVDPLPDLPTAVRTAPSPEGEAMFQSALSQHAEAMLAPKSEQERRITVLYTELVKLADAHQGDPHVVEAIEHLGSAIIALINLGVDRLDQSSIDKSVRDAVQRAGGDADDL
jgi:hypothetical protein